MTLRQRLTLFVAIIVLLFAANVAMYFWSSHQRSLAMDESRRAVAGQLLLAESRQSLDELHKAILVLSALRDTLDEPPDSREISRALAEIAALEREIEALGIFTHPGTTEHYDRVIRYVAELAPMWRDFYLSFSERTPGAEASARREEQFAATMGELLLLEDALGTIFERANRDIRRIVRFTDRATLAVFITSILVTLLFAWIMLRGINRALEDLHAGATAFGRGDLDHRIPVSSRDELGQLAEAFNDMSTRLQEAMEDVRQAQIAADEANRAKTRFLANMSHELRSPLSAIIGCSEMLLDELEDGPVDPEHHQQQVANIRTAGGDLLRLIDDLLDLSKIEAGHMNLQSEKFDSVEILESIVDTLRPLAVQADNELQLRVMQRPGMLDTDLTRFRQLFFNLLSNACKFTRNGQISLSVDVDDRGQPRYRVRDSGIGMSPEQIDRVFEAFVQGDDSTSREYGGTGLGLALCRQYCELMGGSIEVQSKAGLGTEFTVLLPADATTRVAVADPAPAAAEIEASAPGGLRVLVIDDDPVARSLAKNFLGKHGHGVREAEDGQAGIGLAGSWHPDAILLDIMMPRVDGWTVLSVLKADPATADIPVILQSMLDEKALGLEMGAAHYLQKPLDWQALERILAQLSPARARRPALVLDDRAAQRDHLVNELNERGWHALPCPEREQAAALLSAHPSALLVAAVNDHHFSPGQWCDWLAGLQAQWPRATFCVALDASLAAEYQPRIEAEGFRAVARDGFDASAVLETAHSL